MPTCVVCSHKHKTQVSFGVFFCTFIWSHVLYCASSVISIWAGMMTCFWYCHSHGFSHECTVYIPRQAANSCNCFAHLLLPGLHHCFSSNWTEMTLTLTVHKSRYWWDCPGLLTRKYWKDVRNLVFCMTSKLSWPMKANENIRTFYMADVMHLCSMNCMLFIDLSD